MVWFVILMSILRYNKKLTNIYQYVKYKLRHFYRREFAFQKGNPGKVFQVYKTTALPTKLRQHLANLTAQLARKIISLNPNRVKIFCLETFRVIF